DTLTYQIDDKGQPAHGQVTIDPAKGSWEYTPSANYHGPDHFDVAITDGHGGSKVVTVTVDVTPVNDIPTGDNSHVTTKEDVPVNGTV
uniref:Ig-like domain-containing protein n=1 Tax=Photobacterium leiognathi TaxID=553611 RepID=UPI0029826B00